MSLHRWKELHENAQLTLLPMPLVIKRIGLESERHETYQLVIDPDRSCRKLADSDPWNLISPG